MSEKNGTREFVKDIKSIALTVAASVITAMIIWEATAIVDIKTRIARIEAELEWSNYHVDGSNHKAP